MEKQNNIDKSNMKEVILNSPDQLEKGLVLARDIKVSGEFKNVIVCGIGGSALPVNILNSVVSPSVPVYIHRDYGLPEVAGKDSLIICISYSGNTEETVSALEEAIEKNLKIITVATGGKLEELSEKNNIPLVKIPSGIQPRSATGYLFSALAVILTNCGIITDISSEIIKTAKNLNEINSQLEIEGKSLAEKLEKKIPVVYASNKLKAAARIFKIKFNENSKIPAFHNYFPELNHNEMVGYTDKNRLENLFVIIIKDKNDHVRTIKRMDLLADILDKKDVKTSIIQTKDGDFMFRIFSVLLLGDWTSYYVAINNETDPTPVVMVEEFKKMMQK